MLFSKRGLSEVITTVLILLLVLVAIGTIWAAVSPMLKKTGTQLGAECFTIDLEATTCFYDDADTTGTTTDDFYIVDVKRGAGAGRLYKIRFLFTDGVTTKTVLVEDALGELESDQYGIDADYYLGGNFLEPDPVSDIKVTVAAQLKDRACNPVASQIECEEIPVPVAP